MDTSWDEMDSSDPNYVNYPILKQMEQLYNEMPEGWSRNTDFTRTKAPYVHLGTGQASFQHPNRAKMDALVKEIQDKEATVADSSKTTPSSPQIKKLRMMLQSGIPVGAVEQKAKLEGIDMSLVLGESTNDNKETMVGGIPVPLVKKYKRMIKSGVPLEAVHTMAHVEGKWTSQQVMEAVGDVLEERNKENNPSSKDTGGTAETIEPKLEITHPAFTVTGNSVSFPEKSSRLANLVRKMAQTVQKRASTSKDGKMVVSALVLYNALGALQGVQGARDSYNTTCSEGFLPATVAIKRQGFSEMARSIGIHLPLDFTEKVNIPGLDELVRCVEQMFQKEIKAHMELMAEGLYDFDGLALLYPPGSKVVAKGAGGGGVDMMCQVAWNRYEQGRTIMGQPMKYFKVCFQYVAAVGASHATMVETVEGMELFEGRRTIQSALKFVPLAAFSALDQQRLLELYRKRGRAYNKVALRGEHAFMSYEKGSFFMKRGSSMGKSNGATALATGGRVIVDTQGAYDNGHSLGIGYDPMVLGIKYKYKEYSLYLRSAKKGSDQGGTTTPSDDGSLILFDQVPTEYLDMVWPLVVGFSLTAKAWGDILIDGLDEIQWQEDIFDRLVLPEKRKMMVKALVRHSTNSFQDLVQGKGEGTVFLMYGPPGVGKTLTAEAVAELLHKPLYSLSLGTLGSTPRELEQELGQIMNMSARWDALILLDEADSFLETRSSNSSLERNAMVSVMLKLVEYFSGILFLTSNRIDSLDPAFQTRITLALRYENLDPAGRAKVWRNLLMKSGFRAQLEDGTIVPEALSKSSLNGREIKNALRLAMAFSAEKEEELSQSIILETIEIVNDYKTSMKDTKVEAEEEDTC